MQNSSASLSAEYGLFFFFDMYRALTIATTVKAAENIKEAARFSNRKNAHTKVTSRINMLALI